MTMNPDGTVDPMILGLITELHTLEALLIYGCLNDDGLDYGYRFAADANNTAAGNAAIVRERVLAGFVNALAHRHNMPTSYWTDRLTVPVPDDPSALTEDGTA